MKITAYIESTLLKSAATGHEIEALCAEAIELRFFGVCVNPRHILLCQSLLQRSGVTIVTVIGFPLGANSTLIKALEAEQAIRDGANEIDMVLAVGAIKDNNWAYVEDDIRAVVKAAASVPVKVIIETGLLTDEEKVQACKASVHAGAKFVKTCTGFCGGAATVSDIQLMRGAVPAEIGIKASGGIKSLQQAIELIGAGASRLGTSAGRAITSGQVLTNTNY